MTRQLREAINKGKLWQTLIHEATQESHVVSLAIKEHADPLLLLRRGHTDSVQPMFI